MKNLIFLISISGLFGNLISPKNEQTLNQTQVLFEWKQIPDANYYEIEIDTLSNFSNPILRTFDDNLIYIEKNVIEWNKNYFWRLRPIYFSDNPGVWSTAQNFRTSSSKSSSETIIYNELSVQPGLTIFGSFFNYFSAIIDQNGKEIWNSGNSDLIYYSLSQTGNILGSYYRPSNDHNLPGIEITIGGQLLWEEPNEKFLHHDMIRLPNGNYLGIVETISMGPIPIGSWSSSFQNLSYQADGNTIEFPWIGDKLIEWDKDTGEEVWTWSVFDHFDMSDYDKIGGTWTQAYFSLRYDWTHINSVIFDEEESALYISTRHLSRISKIDYPSGEIMWNIGRDMPSGDVTMGTDIGFSFQHSLEKLDNGNILSFDNGNLAPQFRGVDQPTSRAIEISVDNYTASLVWSYELPESLFGFASGNAQKLNNGNVLITTVGGGGRSLEVSNQGDLVWEGKYNLSLPNGAVYRANRIDGLFPNSYSVLVHNYTTSGMDTVVHFSDGPANLFFTISNESKYQLNLSCEIDDSKGWFDFETVNVSLNPHAEEEISFPGSIEEITGNQNLIKLRTIPNSQPELSKEVSFLGVVSNLNLKNENFPNTISFTRLWPNPFNAAVNIEYLVNGKNRVHVQIFNNKGNLVKTLTDRPIKNGIHNLRWEPLHESSGVYFVVIRSDGYKKVKKMIYLK
tara:strand:- start:2935 stop:4971 length:2037 start_codon:yes stop_codon:yes gene_type:complete